MRPWRQRPRFESDTDLYMRAMGKRNLRHSIRGMEPGHSCRGKLRLPAMAWLHQILGYERRWHSAAFRDSERPALAREEVLHDDIHPELGQREGLEVYLRPHGRRARQRRRPARGPRPAQRLALPTVMHIN